MDSQLCARLRDAKHLCDLLWDKGKKSGLSPTVIIELRSLSDTLGHLISEYEPYSRAGSDNTWEQFWRRFGKSLDDCQRELAELGRILDGMSQQGQTNSELALRRIGQLRPNIVLYSKTGALALEIMKVSGEDVDTMATALDNLLIEIAHVMKRLPAPAGRSMMLHGSQDIVQSIERTLQSAKQWASTKISELKKLPEIASESTSINPTQLGFGAENSGFVPDTPYQNREIITSRASKDTLSRELSLVPPELDEAWIEYRFDTASKHVDAGEFASAEKILEELLFQSERAKRLKLELRDKAMVLLSITYCNQRKFMAANKLVRENVFQGKESVIDRLVGIYLKENMWSDLLQSDFKGHDSFISTIVQKLCTARKWDEAEELLELEFEGKGTFQVCLGLAYCDNKMWEKAKSLVTSEFEGRQSVMEKLAAGYYRCGKVDEAEPLVIHLLESKYSVGTETLEIFFALALEYFNRGDLQKAGRYCGKVVDERLSKSLKYGHALAFLLRIYDGLGRKQEAEEFKALLPLEYREIARLSRLDPESAANEISLVLKKLIPKLTNTDLQDIESNVRKSKPGVLVHEAGFSLIHAFARLGNEEVVELLLEKQANVDSRDGRRGDTPLTYAAREGHILVVKLLLDKGAKVDAQLDDGSTSLLCATRNGHEGVVKLLLAAGADIEAVDANECTPLIWAACNGEEKIVTLLLGKGAETAARTKEEGYTALMQAAAKGHENIVKLLLEKGADINAKNKLDNTALIQAITHGHKAVVRVLLENKANIDIESKQRRLGFGPRMKAIDFARKNWELRMLLKR